MTFAYMIICTFVFSLVLNIIYFKKKHISSAETKIYSLLLIVNLIGLLTEFICSYIGINYTSHVFLSKALTKLYLIYLMTFLLLMTLYIYMLCYVSSIRPNLQRWHKLKKTSIIIYIICSIFVLFLPIDTRVGYADGLSVNFVYLCSTLTIFIWFIPYIKNRNLIKKKKIAPLILFIILTILLAIIQKINPHITITTIMEFLIIFIMYHTIENPDMKMVEALQKAKDEADRANHAKTDFLSSMSHEIRTPLNAIVGFSDCVNNATSLTEAKENAKDIVNASKTLLEIVNGILDISKIESGKLELVCSSYDARSTFQELATLITPKMEEKNLKFTYYIAPDVPKTLYGDYANVKKIVTNLLSNAAKYTDKGFVRYEVSCVNANDISRLIISVEDSGRGIKQEAVDKLFTKFQRLDEDRNTTIEGTGLGLAITKQLVDLMGGKIVVHTVYGSGSKFTVMIPQKISNEVIEVAPAPPVQVKTIKKDVNLKDVKILIVDDNNLNLKVASKLLERYGANNITTVNSGFDCLDRISSGEKYDLIFMDDMMPKMSGAETFSKLKEMPGFITPVVALTANAVSGMRENYLELGFDEYLAKPIEKEELKRVLGIVLKEKKEEIANVTVVDNTAIEKGTATKEEYLKENGVAIDKALTLLGDMNMYEATLKDFLKEIDSRWEKIKSYKESGDLANYAVEVHSLKSDCKYLGFTKLANISFLHELKSKDNDKEYINNHFKDLEEAYNNAIKIMKRV